jgi:hypothetical protein
MKGFPDLSSQSAVGADSVVLATCMWGALSDFEFVYQLSLGCYCTRFFHILYLLYSIFCFPRIYIYISNWFSPGGFIQGHVDQKYLCTQMH